MPEFHVYEPFDRPDVEVWIDDGADGAWWPGEATMRTTHADGTHQWTVHWHRDAETRTGTFTEPDIRPDTVDRSHGRTVGGES